MIFSPPLARKVMDGSKTVTRRACSENPRSPWARQACGVKVGRDYSVQMGRAKPAVGRIRILAVDRLALGQPTAAEARLEGFGSPGEFVIAWTAINGAYIPDQLVWRVEFELAAVLDA